jgi:hypothetical protein
VEIILDNTDEVRHDLMIRDLNPMFAQQVVGPILLRAPSSRRTRTSRCSCTAKVIEPAK